MVSHAIKMSSVSKNADGKVINARFLFFNTSGLLPPSPCAFHLCQLHKRKGVSPVKQRNIFFSLLYALFPLSLLYYHMSKGKIVGFLPEALKASSVEQIC